MELELFKQITGHDWRSDSNHIERVEIIKKLRMLPMNKVYLVLKDIEVDLRNRILIMMQTGVK